MKKSNESPNNPKQLSIFSEPAVAYAVDSKSVNTYCTHSKPAVISLVDAACKKALKLLKAELKANDNFPELPAFTVPERVKDYLKITLALEEREHFHCLFLDNQHRLLEDARLFSGTIDGASVYPREVVKAALQYNSAAVIFAHNHPSGITEPSTADKQITEKLKQALALLDIRVLDHLIVGNLDIYSFAENALL